MELQFPRPSRPPSRLLDHLLLWGVAGATLVLFATARDFYRGLADFPDVLAFAASFLATGYVASNLPRIWRVAGRGRLAGCVTPAFMALVLAYLVLACRAGLVQPAAAAIAVLAQVVTLVVVCLRAA